MNVWASTGNDHVWDIGEAHPATSWEGEIDRLMEEQLFTLKAENRKCYTTACRRSWRNNFPSFASPVQTFWWEPNVNWVISNRPPSIPTPSGTLLNFSFTARKQDAGHEHRAAKAKVSRARHTADSRLVRECIEGSEEAWSALIDKYKNLIYSIPVRYGFSEEDSADIFQAVCLDLLAELPRLREPNALAGWLIQISRNKCFHRKQAQRRHTMADIDGIDISSEAEEPGDLIDQTQREQRIREALSDLSPRCRQLMEMLFFESPARPYQQVASELELAQGSIGFIRRRCLNKLRERLEKMGH